MATPPSIDTRIHRQVEAKVCVRKQQDSNGVTHTGTYRESVRQAAVLAIGLATHAEFTGMAVRRARQAIDGGESASSACGERSNQLWFIVGNEAASAA